MSQIKYLTDNLKYFYYLLENFKQVLDSNYINYYTVFMSIFKKKL